MNDEMVCKGVTLVYFCLFIYQCTPTPTPTNQFIYIFCLSNQGKGICITQFTSKKEQELFFVSSFIYRRHILLETMKMSRKLLTGIKKKKKKKSTFRGQETWSHYKLANIPERHYLLMFTRFWHVFGIFHILFQCCSYCFYFLSNLFLHHCLFI